MNRTTVMLLIALIGLGTLPAFADTQADIAEAERQIELRQLAKEVRSRARDRAMLARGGSSVYKAWEAVTEKWKPIREAAMKQAEAAVERYEAAKKDASAILLFMDPEYVLGPQWNKKSIDAQIREYESAMEKIKPLREESSRLVKRTLEVDIAANSEAWPLFQDWKALEETLYKKFLEEETLSAIKSLVVEREREILRKLIQKRGI